MELSAEFEYTTAQFIVTGDPVGRHLIPPRIEHLQTRLGAGVIPYLFWYVAGLASRLVACPLLRQGQAEVEQGMLVTADVAHEHADLAGVDFSPVAALLPFDTIFSPLHIGPSKSDSYWKGL